MDQSCPFKTRLPPRDVMGIPSIPQLQNAGPSTALRSGMDGAPGVSGKMAENIPRGLKPAAYFAGLMYGLKPVPFIRMNLSAVCKATFIDGLHSEDSTASAPSVGGLSGNLNIRRLWVSWRKTFFRG
jgi:hypothetical protein